MEKEAEQKTVDELKMEKARKMKDRYKHYDKNRFGVSNDLTKEWIAEHILDSRCEYCGEDNWDKLGCDRIDNSKPHTTDNCICACTRCNRLRGNKFSVEDMKEIGEVIKRIERRNTIYQIAKRKGKKVAKVDRYGNIVKVYPSITETKIDGYDRCCVGKAASSYVDSRGYDRSVYKGYYWKFL